MGFFVGNDCANNYNFGLSSLGESDLEGSNKILRSISKNLYITLSLSLSISFSISLSLYVSLSLYLYLSLSLFISLYLCLYLCLYLFLYLSLSLSISLYLCLSLSLSISVSLSLYLYISLYLCLSLSISVSLYLSLSLSPFIFQIPFCRCGFHSIPKSPTNMIPKTVTLLSDATGKSFKDTALSEEESLFEMLTMS